MAALKLPIDEVVHFTVTTRDPSTGGESDATGDVVFNIYEEATDTPIASSPITMTKRTSLTGRYRGTFTMSAANGFEAGKFYDVIVTGTVGGVTDNYPAMLIHCVAAESVTGVPKVDQHALGGDTQSATDLKDFADAGYDPSTNKVQGVVLVDTTTTYTGNTPQTGDAYARLGSPAGASVSADIADLPTNAELATSQAAADDATLAAIAALNNITAADVWASATRTLTTIDEDSTTLDLDATIRTAVGLAAANLDTQLGDLPTNAELATALTNLDAAVSTRATPAQILTTQLTEAYRATGAAPTLSQAVFELIAHMGNSDIVSTTKSLRKLDKTTLAKSFTLDDDSAPTAIEETT